jgi:hypothetical protein
VLAGPAQRLFLGGQLLGPGLGVPADRGERGRDEQEQRLGYILWSNIGTKVVTVRRYVIPLVLVGLAGAGYLRHVPTLGNDGRLELAGIVAGVVFGVVATSLVRAGRDAEGRVTMTAGPGFAALWVVVIGGRMLFAYGAEHWFAAGMTTFSIDHRITGANAWTAAFVLMALAMVLTRVVLGGARALSVPRRPAPVAA